MADKQIEEIEEDLSNTNIANSSLRRPVSPTSSTASNDSFHSASNDETNSDDTPKHRLRNMEGTLPSENQIIEPNDQEKDEDKIKDSTPSDEANFLNENQPKCSYGSSPDGTCEVEDEEEEEFLNEEHLKDLELSMTEEEKVEKRNESQGCKETGNAKFKAGQYVEAVESYTNGLRICPISFPKNRAILYSNRAAAKAKMDMKKEAIKDCTKAIDLDESYTKAILRRANLNEDTTQLDDALQDFKRVLELDPYNQEALQAVRNLPDKINERNEKLKEEMMGKLKDLGNMILRPFGLSTNNFELKQDASSGGYNVSFNQNPR